MTEHETELLGTGGEPCGDEPQHTVVMTADRRSGPMWDLYCPFENTDETRPCWPSDETGEPDPTEMGVATGCVYAQWWGEMSTELIFGMPATEWPVVSSDWTGDGFEFVLGQPSFGGDKVDG